MSQEIDPAVKVWPGFGENEELRNRTIWPLLDSVSKTWLVGTRSGEYLGDITRGELVEYLKHGEISGVSWRN